MNWRLKEFLLLLEMYCKCHLMTMIKELIMMPLFMMRWIMTTFKFFIFEIVISNIVLSGIHKFCSQLLFAFHASGIVDIILFIVSNKNEQQYHMQILEVYTAH